MESSNKLEHYIEIINQFLIGQDPLLLILGESRPHEKELVETIIKRNRAEFHIIHMTSRCDSTPLEIIDLITKHWAKSNAKPDEKLETQIQSLLEALSTSQQPCLLVLDYADQLPLNTLAALSHIAMHQETKLTNLHIILAGNPTLDDSLKNLIAKEPLRLILNPMSHSEAHKYMHRYFEKKDINANNTALQQIMERIYCNSYGLPKKMVALLRKISSEQLTVPVKKNWRDNLPTITVPNISKKNITRITSLAGLVVLGFYLTLHQHSGFNASRLPIGDHFIAIKSLKSQDTAKLENINTDNVEAQIQMQIDESKQLTPKRTHHLPRNTIIAENDEDTPIKIVPTKPLHIAIKKQVNKKVIVHQKIIKLPSKFYTLQLMSTNNKNALNNYKQKHHLNAALIKTKYKGKDWFLLGYGHFKTREMAKQALKKAPPTIKKFNPWVRPIKQT